MATQPDLGPLDFLQGAPAPAEATDGAPEGAASAADRLPDAVVEALMALPGVDGVWIERDGAERVVVLHHTPGGPAPHLPARVEGLAVRIVGGEPIRAQPR